MRPCKVTNTPFFLPLPDQAGARTRARHRLKRARTRPQPPTEGSCPPRERRSVSSGLERHVRGLVPGHLHAHKRESARPDRHHAVGRLRHTYSTPHTDQDTPIHIVERSGHSVGAGGTRWGVGRKGCFVDLVPSGAERIRERRCPSAPPAQVGERPAVGRGRRVPRSSRVFTDTCRPAVARASHKVRQTPCADGSLFLCIFVCSSEGSTGASGTMPSVSLRCTYSTPHMGQDTPKHVVERGVDLMGARGHVLGCG